MGKPKGSYSVMSQRHEPPNSLDFFVTPPWATRALCEWLGGRQTTKNSTCWEPACGDGAMTRPLREYFYGVYGSDIHDYEWGHAHFDFLEPNINCVKFDWIITNPPFKLAEKFALTSIERATVGCAMLVRTAFIESIGRYERLFSKHPPTMLQFVERVPMVKGRLDPKASSATAYCWLVWSPRSRDRGSQLFWIPPCRKRLEREGDYPVQA